MDRQQVRFALLKITALVLLGTTWVFWSFVYATRPDVNEQRTLVEAPAEVLVDTLIRLPASLPAHLQPTTRTLAPVEMNVVPLNCWDIRDLAERPTRARLMRLTGKACGVAGTADNVTVKNISNGYAATVFEGSVGLTTDFIPLESGKNEILIKIESEPGVTLENQFIFTRE